MNTRVNFALSSCAAAALLAGCGGSQPSITSFTSTQNVNRTPAHGKKVFNYTGGTQIFGVPNGVTEITVTAMGASGASDGSSAYGVAMGGKGGLTQATILVKPGDKLAVYVGGSGVNGGFNGGAPGGGNSGSSTPGGYGGGASDVRMGGTSLEDRVVVAGGGGGGAAGGSKKKYAGGNGGEGGGPRAGKGAPGTGFYVSGSYGAGGGAGGGGGRQKAGGKGGAGGQQHGSGFLGGAGFSGMLGMGGSSAESANWAAGGGGGGGYYGGGGGGQGGAHCSVYCNRITVAGGGGGGGGSSYVENGATNVKEHRGGAKRGDGQIIISW